MKKHAVYLIIDTETTGFDPLHNGLIQFACAALDDRLEIIATMEADVCPHDGCSINEESLAINGFTRERMRE
ncbi:MAG TPA: exonuclease domain-containing protein [bacterium]|nr:exonuclease domain-containing protein [bacterium]